MSVSSRSFVRLPPGVRDFLPRAAARRRAIAERLLAEFEAWGYARIITPVFECADVLERGLGEDARQAAIRFVEPGTGEVVALRPDITPQVARIAATRIAEVDGPLRYCYEGAVTRMPSGARVQRELLQAGVELIGAGAPEADAEVISVAVASLATMDIEHVRLDLGHVAPARCALAAVEDLDRRADIARLLAKKARAEVARAAAGLPATVRAALEALPTLLGEPRAVLRRARALDWPAPVRAALDGLEEVLALSRQVVESEQHATIMLDLGEVRGFDYYTGIRFSGFVDGVGEAVLRGGRYDDLVACYGRAAHATGFAADIEAIAEAQATRGIALPTGAAAVLVVATQRRRREAMRIAAGLRAQGVRAAVDLGRRRGRAALATYAREVGFTHILSLAGSAAEAASCAGPDAAAPPPRQVSQASLRRAAGGDARALAAIFIHAQAGAGASSRPRASTKRRA
ncbi:ATP phosphoribosyltransferase regulatory subunit [Haliangium sp.]|uniref:ATP phosphoribosyltransferase regulatory subunit n=1 Tax=Haliangium sp. TaxID=2663208 RepID=UPI003D09FE62